jgi:hypothetical protein
VGTLSHTLSGAQPSASQQESPSTRSLKGFNRLEAERGGFEPPKRLPVYSISSAAPSAARTPLRVPHTGLGGGSLADRPPRAKRSGLAILPPGEGPTPRTWCGIAPGFPCAPFSRPACGPFCSVAPAERPASGPANRLATGRSSAVATDGVQGPRRPAAGPADADRRTGGREPPAAQERVERRVGRIDRADHVAGTRWRGGGLVHIAPDRNVNSRAVVAGATSTASAGVAFATTDPISANPHSRPPW